MKAAEPVKSSTASAQPQSKAVQPFFQKKGADSALTSGRDFFASEASAERFFQPAPAFIQAQLAVGAPNDPYEQEADKVAGQVMEGYDQASNIQRKLSDLGVQHTLIQPMTIGSRISRKIQRILSRTPLAVQAKCTDCEKEEKMQQKSAAIQFAGEGSSVSPDIEAKIHSMRGGGQSMDAQTKGAMESSFGADFSNVRVHTGNQAVQMSQNLNAHAFTVGSDIFFNEGRYQPQTKQGAGLLAHELTHTVQQGAALQNKRIDRQPLANLLSGHTVAHLSAMSGQAGLYRQQIAQLQRGPEEDLQMKEVDQVQKKDATGMLRRCDGGTPAATRPTVDSWAVRNSGNTSADNCCALCPVQLGVNNSAGTKFTNGIELKAVINNHSAGFTYDIFRVKHRKTYKKLNNAWQNVSDTGANASDDSHNDDECLTPILSGSKHKIYSIDAPGFPDVANPIGDNNATDAVYVSNFTESVKINGTEDATKQNWHTVIWVVNSGGTWSVDAAKSEITSGHRASLSP